MKRMLLLGCLFFLSAGTASADYVLVKIDINKLDFFPPSLMAALQQGPQGTGMGGGQPAPPMMPPGGGFAGGIMPPQPGAPPVPGTTPPEDTAKWISAFVELRTKPQGIGMPLNDTTIWSYKHKWSDKGPVWMTISPHYPMFERYLPKESFGSEFTALYKKEVKDKAKKKPEDLVSSFMHLARMALARNSLYYFHDAMKEVSDADSKFPVSANYLRVKKELDREFKQQDPAQTDFLDDLVKNGYQKRTSKEKHFSIYAQISNTDKATGALIDRRLKMMENSLELFYYWFVLQGDQTAQPPLPKYHFNAVLTRDKEEFLARHAQWGSQPMLVDGFTTRRENLMILCARPRVNDPRFEEFEAVLTNKLQEGGAKLRQMGINVNLTRDDLLTGELNKSSLKEAGKGALFIAAAQTAVLLSRALEDEAERATITNETIRQILISAEIFPRNVAIPDWMIEGLAAYFETPIGAVYPGTGMANWKHFVSFKHLRETNRLDKAPEILYNVITDRYFREARRKDTKQAWEMARCTAWSFVYHLAEKQKMDLLFKYGKELNQLPRDMDLDEPVLQACFAKGFELTDPKNTRRIEPKRFSNMAAAWFSTMQVTNLSLMEVQPILLKQRELLEPEYGGATALAKNGFPPGITPPIGGIPVIQPNPMQPNPNPMPNPPVVIQPNPLPPNPMPNPNPLPPNPMPQPMPQPIPPQIPPQQIPPQQGANLANTNWGGSETLGGYGKLEFRFQAGNQVIMVDKDGNTPGTYNVQGNTVTLSFYNNTVNYTGTINGQTLAGGAQNGGTNWTFSVTSGATNIVAPMPQPQPFPGPIKRPPIKKKF